MKNSKKYAESRKLHSEGYLCEVGMEFQDIIEVQSISSASRNGRDGRKRDTSVSLQVINYKTSDSA